MFLNPSSGGHSFISRWHYSWSTGRWSTQLDRGWNANWIGRTDTSPSSLHAPSFRLVAQYNRRVARAYRRIWIELISSYSSRLCVYLPGKRVDIEEMSIELPRTLISPSSCAADSYRVKRIWELTIVCVLVEQYYRRRGYAKTRRLNGSFLTSSRVYKSDTTDAGLLCYFYLQICESRHCLRRR